MKTEDCFVGCIPQAECCNGVGIFGETVSPLSSRRSLPTLDLVSGFEVYLLYVRSLMITVRATFRSW